MNQQKEFSIVKKFISFIYLFEFLFLASELQGKQKMKLKMLKTMGLQHLIQQK